VITIIIFSLVIGIASNSSIDLSEEDDWWIAPEIQNMRSQRKMANELERQNDLRERELELYKQPEKE
jgi:hypothetical protein